jgi:hypothetical protein
MEIIIGIGAAVALLYYWLLGHWFARVLTTIVFVPLLAVIGGGIVDASMSHLPGSPAKGTAIIGAGIIGTAIAWCAASAPVWYWRRALGINS